MTSVEPNTIAIQGHDYVLAWVGVDAAHLVAEASDGQPARAIVDHRDELNPAYDASVLADPSWAPRTLCGRDEWFMCPTDAGRAFQSPYNGQEEAVLAPTCKRCLRILDAQFAEPAPDERLASNVSRAVEQLEQSGGFLIRGVPADQIELLRRRVRAEARKRGWKVQSSSFDDVLMASCPDALSPEQHQAALRDAMDRVNAPVTGKRFPEPSWRFDWS